jgi:hypothetical protein
MATVRKSFLSNFIGKDTYDRYKAYSKRIIMIGTCILVLLFLLTQFVYSEVVSYLLRLVTGTSLLFIAYIAVWILVLDIEVDVEEPEKYFWNQEVKSDKPTTYKMTIVWGVILVILGISAIYFSNKYRKQYAFECETFLVDKSSRIYHIVFNDCEVAESASSLEEMKGYEIEESNYTFCEWCKEWLEEAESEYESSRYSRR